MSRILAALTAAEWILIFKTWVPGRTLFLLVCAAALRLYVCTTLLPNFYGASVIFFIAGITLIWHLKSAIKGETRHNIDLYQTPDTGVRKLIVIARNSTFAEFLEGVILFMVLMAYVSTTPVYTHTFAYPPDVEKWLHENARTVASILGGLQWFGVVIWNSLNFKKKAKSKKEPDSPYKAVRPQPHSRPELLNVNSLIKQYEVDGRDF